MKTNIMGTAVATVQQMQSYIQKVNPAVPKYRTNQRLEKVNERLTEENARLKAENKDYSLLCKVFGRKQIDDLLEQARTIKGRKRDNSRSR